MANDFLPHIETEEEFQRIIELIDDPEMPNTFEDWRNLESNIRRDWQNRGLDVVPVSIDASDVMGYLKSINRDKITMNGLLRLATEIGANAAHRPPQDYDPHDFER